MSEGRVELDAVVVGAGFAGMYQLIKLSELGLTAKAFEAGDGVGGTWYWNRYPGARCDVESLEYSYGFSSELEQEWVWTERYPTQPEIERYANHVADRFDLRKDIQFETRVTAAHYDDATGRWHVDTDKGDRVSATYLVMASGCLSHRQDPRDRFTGVDSFKGDWYHTAAWPKGGVDFTGKRVGIIGTGSTAIQVIPQVAKQAEHLTVFQRTANFSVPAMNRLLSDEEQDALKARYQEHRQDAKESAFGVPVPMPTKGALECTADEQFEALESRWQAGGVAPFMLAFTDVLINQGSNDVVADFIRSKIRTTVKDPAVAELLCPNDHPLGTKRPCVDIDYFETYNRDNVSLVSVRKTPIEEITPNGIRTTEKEYELDAIVFAIGFDAMTGALFDIDITGRDGLALTEAWKDGPRTYLGIMTAGFPNMFLITGPQSPSVLSNMMVSIEQHVEWLSDAIAYVRERGLDTIEATTEAQDAWVDHSIEVGNSTLYPKANSWYMGANVPGKVRVFTPYIGGVGPYREKCNEVVAAGYEGFALSSSLATA
ncbi:MAG: NAD(P)/FAD-dependent oxidoreductase [Actinobacteria bacterium]|nr:NAD(P)/FAD-dependent oxidoreductase [Actinomycetota bacterium]